MSYDRHLIALKNRMKSNELCVCDLKLYLYSKFQKLLAYSIVCIVFVFPYLCLYSSIGLGLISDLLLFF